MLQNISLIVCIKKATKCVMIFPSQNALQGSCNYFVFSKCFCFYSNFRPRNQAGFSIPKYTKAKNSEISFHKGDTVGQLNDLFSFGKVNVQGYCIFFYSLFTS